MKDLPDRSRQGLNRPPDLADRLQRTAGVFFAVFVVARDEDAFLDAAACDGMRRAEEEGGEKGEDLRGVGSVRSKRKGGARNAKLALSCSSPSIPRVHQTRSIPPSQYPKTAIRAQTGPVSFRSGR